jgi:beta-glucosidase
VHFDEGLNVGYRYWDAHGQQPLFPFGFGLSYTRFTLSNGRVTAQPSGGATVEIDVRNTGARAGAEVVQAYLACPRAAGEPPKQLRSFAKVMLQPGEQRRVQLRLDRPAFEYWDEKQRGWTVARGAYGVEVGSSSRDIAFVGEVTLRYVSPDPDHRYSS